MQNFIQIKRTQIHYYQQTPLYYRTDSGDFALYKAKTNNVENDRISKNAVPQLFINKQDKKIAIKELHKALNKDLEINIASKNLIKIKSILYKIVEEALSGPLDEGIEYLPDTIDVMFQGYSKNSEILKTLATISTKQYSVVEHSINVMAITMRYCFYTKCSLDDTKELSLTALLHDIGKTQIDDKLLIANRTFSDKEFGLYQTHTSRGHDILKQIGTLHKSQYIGALEHHERIDGSGYPRGIAYISFEGQLLGLIDSFESLSNTNKKDNKMIRKPFDILLLIRDEVIREGKFNKKIFADLCASFA